VELERVIDDIRTGGGELVRELRLGDALQLGAGHVAVLRSGDDPPCARLEEGGGVLVEPPLLRGLELLLQRAAGLVRIDMSAHAVFLPRAKRSRAALLR
jgi:hypothetical protein